MRVGTGIENEAKQSVLSIHREQFFSPYREIILLERGITILHTCTALYAMAAIQSVCNPKQL